MTINKITLQDLPFMILKGTIEHYKVEISQLQDNAQFFTSKDEPDKLEQLGYKWIGATQHFNYFCIFNKPVESEEIIQDVAQGVTSVITTKNWLSAIPSVLGLITKLFGRKK